MKVPAGNVENEIMQGLYVDSKLLERIANEVIADLSEEDKEYMVLNPDPIMYHFTLGMYIRNQYIYEKEEFANFIGQPDDVSNDIIELVIEKLSSERNQ